MGPTRSPSMRDEMGERIGQDIGRGMEIVFSTYVTVVFIVLWLYVALALFTDSALPADTWAWLSSLETIAAVVVWLAILPVAVFLWAWQADLSTLLMGLVMLGLIAWTAVAFAGLIRALRRRLVAHR